MLWHFPVLRWCAGSGSTHQHILRYFLKWHKSGIFEKSVAYALMNLMSLRVGSLKLLRLPITFYFSPLTSAFSGVSFRIRTWIKVSLINAPLLLCWLIIPYSITSSAVSLKEIVIGLSSMSPPLKKLLTFSYLIKFYSCKF